MKEYLYSSKPYIIAETAYSFEGDKDYLIKQTKNLSEKADAIKYHLLFNIDEYMINSHSVYNLVKSWIISKSNWIKILTEAKTRGLDTVILVDDMESIKFCYENSELVDAIEIHAACVNDLKLLDYAIEFANAHSKVFIIGISGFEIQELQDISDYLRNKELKDVLMIYGFQNYPTNINDINLSKMAILEDILNYKIGYADHTSFSDVNKEHLIFTAFALGANIQEIHFVLDEGVERVDYSTAIGLKRLETIKNILENSYSAIGNPNFRLNKGEKKYLNVRKVPVYASNLKQGETLDSNSVCFKRVDTPLKQNKFREIESSYGKILKTDVIKDTEISVYDFEDLS